MWTVQLCPRVQLPNGSLVLGHTVLVLLYPYFERSSKMKTKINPDKFIADHTAEGWVVIDEIRDNAFDDYGNHYMVTEYHFEDANGNYEGVLSVSVGNGVTRVWFTPFTVEIEGNYDYYA